MNTITNYEALLAIARSPEFSQPVRDYLVALLAEHRGLVAALDELRHAGCLNVTTRDDARSELAKLEARAALAQAEGKL